jgi:hypothetical protein
MTPRGRDSASSTETTPETGFTWVCSYCKRSRTDQYAGEEEAVAALRSHIGGFDGDGHGLRDEFPADRERTLFEYVRCASGERETVSRFPRGER